MSPTSSSPSRLRGVIDASAFSGRPTGPMVVAHQLLAAWSRHRPEDDITSWVPESDDVGTLRRSVRHLGRPRRAFGSPDALDFYLSLNPTLPPMVPPGVITGVMLFDERHIDEPDRFSRTQIWYRRAMWTTGVRRADVVFTAANSARDRLASTTVADVPVVIPLGTDHVRSIPRDAGTPSIVALCHRENKPPETALDVWRSARLLEPDLPPLVLIGVDSARRQLIERSLTAAEREDITIEGRLPQDRFDAHLGAAAAILFLSSHEGYGLPLAEGLQLGTPVIAFELPSLRQIAGPDYPMAAPGDRADAAQLLVRALRDDLSLPSVELSTWANTVDAIRDEFTRRLAVARLARGQVVQA